MHATTTDFVMANDWMEVRCTKCRRMVWLGGEQITKRFPISTPIPEAERRMRCTCGHRGARITIKAPFRHEVEGDKISFGGRLM